MSVIKATILAQMRNAGIAAADISDDQANQAIEDAVREYTRHRPQLVQGSLTTVADQQEYDLPSGGITLLDCYWSPTSTATVFSRENALVFLRGEENINAADFDYPSLATIASIKESSWRRHFGGTGQQPFPGGKVYLDPTPDEAGKTVRIWYTKEHTFSGGAWTTIPDSDEGLILDGSIIYSVRVGAVEGTAQMVGSYRGGSVSVSDASVGSSRQKVYVDLKKDWVAALAPNRPPIRKA